MKNKKLLSDIKEYLKYYENQVLEDWYELIRHISVSETGEGIETCCDWIQKKMEEIGIQVTKYSVKPAPVLVGRFGNDPENENCGIQIRLFLQYVMEKFMQEEVLIINHL